MEPITTSQPGQQTNGSKSSGSEVPADYNAAIERLKSQLAGCQNALNEKLQKNETDINGICSHINRLEDQIREIQYRQSLESASDPGNAPRIRAKALIGQGFINIRPQAGNARVNTKDSKPREVKAKLQEAQ
jgi:hypothetical protein